MAVFISYRREDSEGDARALYNRLAEETDIANLFLDFEAITAGDDWNLRIDENLNKVKAVLVVIGPKWLEILQSRVSSGASDEVRREIAAALVKPGVLVMPILVKGAIMPGAGELPPDIRALSFKNAIDLRGSAWASDVGRVIKKLRNASALPTSKRQWLWRGAALIGVIALGGTVYAARVEVPTIPKNMSYKYAKAFVENHGLTFKGRVLPYTTDNRGIDAVVDQRPAPGTKLFRGQTVEVELISKQPYYLVCKGGGLLSNITDSDVVPFERHKGAASIDMKPGTCSWFDREIHANQDEFIKPLGFKNDLNRLFERAPGNMLALCVFSEYDLGDKAVKSERYAALDYVEYLIKDDAGRLVPKPMVHICVDHL